MHNDITIWGHSCSQLFFPYINLKSASLRSWYWIITQSKKKYTGCFCSNILIITLVLNHFGLQPLKQRDAYSQSPNVGAHTQKGKPCHRKLILITPPFTLLKILLVHLLDFVWVKSNIIMAIASAVHSIDPVNCFSSHDFILFCLLKCNLYV